MIYKKIVIMGPSGSGKSTFADQIATKLGISAKHLDIETHGPNYSKLPNEERTQKILDIISADTWVIDGNYSNSAFKERLLAADVVVFLDIAPHVAAWRAIKRARNIKQGKESAVGNPAAGKIRLSFLKQILWDYPFKKKREYILHIKEYAADKCIILRSHKERDDFLQKV